MRGDTLHVLWLDWNGHPTTYYNPGIGGHVHHAAVLPNGSLLNNGIQKVADINIDGDIGGWWGSATTFGFAIAPWSQCDFACDSDRNVLYALWSNIPDNGNFGYHPDALSEYGYGNYDIFYSFSPNGGRAWDFPHSLTATNNPGCSGLPGNECQNEYYFTAAPRVAHDTIWVFSLVQKAPGVQETALLHQSADPGPFTLYYDEDRLYKAPIWDGTIDSIRPASAPQPGDTTRLWQIILFAWGSVFNVNMRLSNSGLSDIILDSVRLTGTLNGQQLVTATNAVPNTSISSGLYYDFILTLDPSGVGASQQGVRSGLL